MCNVPNCLSLIKLFFPLIGCNMSYQQVIHYPLAIHVEKFWQLESSLLLDLSTIIHVPRKILSRIYMLQLEFEPFFFFFFL